MARTLRLCKRVMLHSLWQARCGYARVMPCMICFVRAGDSSSLLQLLAFCRMRGFWFCRAPSPCRMQGFLWLWLLQLLTTRSVLRREATLRRDIVTVAGLHLAAAYMLLHSDPHAFFYTLWQPTCTQKLSACSALPCIDRQMPLMRTVECCSLAAHGMLRSLAARSRGPAACRSVVDDDVSIPFVTVAT